MYFNNTRVYTARNIILHILSLISYWTGAIKVEIQYAVQKWFPQNLDEISLQVVDPADNLMLDWVTGADDEERSPNPLPNSYCYYHYFEI